MATVRIVKFNGNGTLDWSHNDGSGENVNIGTLPHPVDDESNEVKEILILECDNCNIKSFYPMSGGSAAQQLHKEHLEADTLENVQADATARGIDTTDKTQEELIELIIKDECNDKGVRYLL